MCSQDQALVTVALNWTNIEPRSSQVMDAYMSYHVHKCQRLTHTACTYVYLGLRVVFSCLGSCPLSPSASTTHKHTHYTTRAAPQVSWELWSTTNDQCGTLCDQQQAFVRAMRPRAQELEASGQARFSPHFVTWSCPPEYVGTSECKNECIMDGMYCAVSCGVCCGGVWVQQAIEDAGANNNVLQGEPLRSEKWQRCRSKTVNDALTGALCRSGKRWQMRMSHHDYMRGFYACTSSAVNDCATPGCP